MDLEAKLLERAKRVCYWFPYDTQEVQLQSWADRMARVSQLAEEVAPFIHPRVSELLQGFLDVKRSHGNDVEKSVYASLDPIRFLTRLLHKRPLSFWGPWDRHCLQSASQTNSKEHWGGYGGFEAIGTIAEKEPLLLQDYISYDEMCISALISVFVPTFFINDGDRASWCVRGKSFVEEGVLVGCVGARLVKEGFMEAKFMLVTPTQNTEANGYGSSGKDTAPLLSLWARFYGLEYFPTYKEVCENPGTRFHKIAPWEGEQESEEPHFLDTLVYSERIRCVVVPFLIKSSQAAGEGGSHVRVKGLGLGCWQVDPVQEALMLEVYADALLSIPLPGIKVLEFAWFPSAKSLRGVGHGGQFLAHSGHSIEVRFTKDGFASLVAAGSGVPAPRLIAMYAWDGNAYPGNEWWFGKLGSTDDSAAASCSLITSLQNPDINPERICGEVVQVFPST